MGNLDQNEAMLQERVRNSVSEKVKNHQALNDNDIKAICPVAFKETMFQSEIEKLGLSKH